MPLFLVPELELKAMTFDWSRICPNSNTIVTRSSYLYRANISPPSNLVTHSNYHKYFSHASLGNICQPQTIFHTRVCLLVQEAATEWSLTFAATSGVSRVVPPKDGWSWTQYSDVTILTVESVHCPATLNIRDTNVISGQNCRLEFSSATYKHNFGGTLNVLQLRRHHWHPLRVKLINCFQKISTENDC